MLRDTGVRHSVFLPVDTPSPRHKTHCGFWITCLFFIPFSRHPLVKGARHTVLCAPIMTVAVKSQKLQCYKDLPGDDNDISAKRLEIFLTTEMKAVELCAKNKHALLIQASAVEDARKFRNSSKLVPKDSTFRIFSPSGVPTPLNICV